MTTTTTTDIDRALAALTPQQRAAWRQQWLHSISNETFANWLRRKFQEMAYIATLRLDRYEHVTTTT